MGTGQIETSVHDFWKNVCGIDTHQRGPKFAQRDTPWNSFTRDQDSLVNTIWSDSIVTITRPTDEKERYFVILGARIRHWKTLTKVHGMEARERLERANKEKIPIFGFEIEPSKRSLLLGKRTIKEFYLDRVHQLNPVLGVTKEDLVERLDIWNEFHKQITLDDVGEMIETGFLYELIPPAKVISGVGVIPNILRTERRLDVEENEKYLNSEIPNYEATENFSRRALQVLVEYVLSQRDNVLVPITYKELARHIGRFSSNGEPWARGLGFVLGKVTEMIRTASLSLQEISPYLTTIVVLSSGVEAGLPSTGVSDGWPGYSELSYEDKRAKVQAEYDRILQFGSRWNLILEQLGFEKVPLSFSGQSGSVSGGRGGGESETHKALKEYVRKHPQQFGAEPSWQALEEFALRSGDEIDVFFQSDTKWIGVEVKSKVSDGFPADYERGLFQVVKYQAVLEAQAKIQNPHRPPVVNVFLALQSRLPPQYIGLAKALAVEYRELVSADESEVASYIE